MTSLERLAAEVRAALGDDAFDASALTLDRYGRHELPSAERRPSLVVYSGSTQDVQAVVRLAAHLGVKLHPISTGENRGMGSRAAG